MGDKVGGVGTAANDSATAAKSVDDTIAQMKKYAEDSMKLSLAGAQCTQIKDKGRAVKDAA